MRQAFQLDSSYSEIMEGKAVRRESLMSAVKLAGPEGLDAASQRLKDVMRIPAGAPRRQRMAPPAFAG